MNLTTFDVVKICTYVAAFALGLIALLPGTGLFPPNVLTSVSGVLSLVAGIAALIANTLKNPSPPTGALSAMIPVGTIPVVGSPTMSDNKQAGGLQVAHVHPMTTVVTPANVAGTTVAKVQQSVQPVIVGAPTPQV